MRVGREDVMGAGPLVLVLVGLVFPISLVLLAVVVDLLTGVWALYELLHDARSARPTDRVAYHH